MEVGHALEIARDRSETVVLDQCQFEAHSERGRTEIGEFETCDPVAQIDGGVREKFVGRFSQRIEFQSKDCIGIQRESAECKGGDTVAWRKDRIPIESIAYD